MAVSVLIDHGEVPDASVVSTSEIISIEERKPEFADPE
jgi:hypothetical protein